MMTMIMMKNGTVMGVGEINYHFLIKEPNGSATRSGL